MKKAFTLIELLIVVAIIAILAAIAVPNFLEAQTRAKVSRVTADMRSYATGLETYYIDYNSYPLYAPFTASGTLTAPPNAGTNINTRLWTATNQTGTNPYNSIPSFATHNTAGFAIGLTSPVSYMNTYSADAFSSFKQATFSYANGPAGFLVWSPGPDSVDALDGASNGAPGGSGNAAESILRGGQSLPSPILIAGPGSIAGAPAGLTFGDAFTYDPTNGTASLGDVYRTK